MREFLRRCPGCGRRLVVRLQSKRLADRETGKELMAHDVVVMHYAKESHFIPAGVTYEEVPIEKEKFDVTFECHHCHHRWMETVFKVEKTK